MGWRLIDPALLRQEDRRYRLVWYQDDAAPEAGGLLAWLDAAGMLTRFQLVHTPDLLRATYCLEWERGRGARCGIVDDGERAGRCKMSPLVRFGPREARTLASLQAYFWSNADRIEPRLRAMVGRALGAVAAGAVGRGDHRV